MTAPARVSGRIRAGAAVMSAVLVLLAAALVVLFGISDAGAALLGVLGWLVALAARLPALASAGRLHDPDRSRTILAATSAVTDEVARLALVLVVAGGYIPALWAGFGWALAELVFVLAAHLARFSRPVGRRAAEQLRSEGGFVSTHPAHAGVRGITTTAFHLGASLLLATGSWWVPVTASAHVAVNLAFARGARRQLVAVQVFGAVVSAALLAAGLIASDLR